jgi:hypothetical protein
MIGSRLLFSGYGAGTSYRRAQGTGLIGYNSLIVHDEAHLSPDERPGSLALAAEVLIRSIIAAASLKPAQSGAEALLSGIQHQAAGDFPAMAAKYVLKLAHEIWESQPVSISALARTLNEGPQAIG